jgi:hypothetical protein
VTDDDLDLSELWLEGVGDGLGPAKIGEQRMDQRRRRGRRHVGFPWAFLADVCQLTDGRTALVVAIHIYRRTCVCRSRTVTLPAAELAELGITRPRKHEALAKLQAAGLIKVARVVGRTAKVTLIWQSK